MTERTHEFLDLYKQLEEALQVRLPAQARRHASVVMDFVASEDSEPYRAKLSLIREIRNLLSHNADMDGEPVIEPALGIVEDLRKILDYVVDPPLATQFMTPMASVLSARPNQSAMKLMRDMEQHGYSHVPVLDEDGKFLGVFSISAFFTYMLDGPAPIFNEETRVKHFMRYLPIKKHKNEAYLFLDAQATYVDIKREFERRKERSRRLVVIFLTQSGSMDEPLLGMVTPWDMLEENVRL